MAHKIALIVIGVFKDEWQGLSSAQQADFIARVGAIAERVGITPVLGYKLISTPGAFLDAWEADDRATIDRAVREWKAMGYTKYIQATWMIGERQVTDTE
jgi:hypothetical protein